MKYIKAIWNWVGSRQPAWVTSILLFLWLLWHTVQNPSWPAVKAFAFICAVWYLGKWCFEPDEKETDHGQSQDK